MKPEEHADAVAKAAKMNQDASAAMPEASVQQFIDNDIDDAGAAKGEQQQKEQAWKDYLAGPQMETVSAFDLASPLTDQPAQEWAADTQHTEEPPAPPPLAQMLGDADTERYQPLEQPAEGKKKRPRSDPQTDWGSLLGSVSHVATSLGQESRSGSSTPGLDQWESILTGKADIPGMLGNAGESIVNLLSGSQSGGNTADSKETSEIAEEKFDDLTKAVEALTKAVEKLTEKMGSIGDKKEREPFAGKGGTNMPDDGSLQGRNQDGTGGTTAKEGNDEIMTTIIRMAMMAAEAV